MSRILFALLEASTSSVSVGFSFRVSSVDLYPVLYRGESRVLTWDVIDRETNLAPDLTIGKWKVAEIEWQMKPSVGAADPPTIGKTLSAGGIVVQALGVLGRIQAVIDPTDTASLAPAAYASDLVVTTSSGARVLLIRPCGVLVADVVNQL